MKVLKICLLAISWIYFSLQFICDLIQRGMEYLVLYVTTALPSTHEDWHPVGYLTKQASCLVRVVGFQQVVNMIENEWELRNIFSEIFNGTFDTNQYIPLTSTFDFLYRTAWFSFLDYRQPGIVRRTMRRVRKVVAWSALLTEVWVSQVVSYFVVCSFGLISPRQPPYDGSGKLSSPASIQVRYVWMRHLCCVGYRNIAISFSSRLSWYSTLSYKALRLVWSEFRSNILVSCSRM